MAPEKHEPLATDHHGCRERSHSVTHMPQVWTRRHQKYSGPCQRKKGHIVVGADASNAFAEAPAPKAPIYLRLDTQFHAWWKSKGRPPIPDGYGVKVLKAIQGHPESPRLWAVLINGIISNIGFKTCKHESCLYYHPNYKGEEVYFIRQVDDFAISCKSKHLADEIIALIDQHMTIKVKPLGVITRFNGVDVHQTQHYIKVNNATYLKKILADKKCTDAPTHNLPLPMSEDSNYNMEIKSAAPLEDRELCQTEKKFGFTYRQGVGELIYAMVTCT